MRLIDADALYQSFGASGNCSNCPHDWYKCQYYNEHTLMEFCERIDDAPTVDAEPIKHGRWIGTEFDGYADGLPLPVFYEWVCSVCGCLVEDEEPIWNYCPYCGAKMDGGGEKDGEIH